MEEEPDFATVVAGGTVDEASLVGDDVTAPESGVPTSIGTTVLALGCSGSRTRTVLSGVLRGDVSGVVCAARRVVVSLRSWWWCGETASWVRFQPLWQERCLAVPSPRAPTALVALAGQSEWSEALAAGSSVPTPKVELFHRPTR